MSVSQADIRRLVSKHGKLPAAQLAGICLDVTDSPLDALALAVWATSVGLVETPPSEEEYNRAKVARKREARAAARATS